MQLDHWCPQTQKMTTLTLNDLRKTQSGLEVATVTACQNQQNCRDAHRDDCLIGKHLEGRLS